MVLVLLPWIHSLLLLLLDPVCIAILRTSSYTHPPILLLLYYSMDKQHDTTKTKQSRERKKARRTTKKSSPAWRTNSMAHSCHGVLFLIAIHWSWLLLLLLLGNPCWGQDISVLCLSIPQSLIHRQHCCWTFSVASVGMRHDRMLIIMLGQQCPDHQQNISLCRSLLQSRRSHSNNIVCEKS